MQHYYNKYHFSKFTSKFDDVVYLIILLSKFCIKSYIVDKKDCDLLMNKGILLGFVIQQVTCTKFDNH